MASTSAPDGSLTPLWRRLDPVARIILEYHSSKACRAQGGLNAMRDLTMPASSSKPDGFVCGGDMHEKCRLMRPAL